MLDVWGLPLGPGGSVAHLHRAHSPLSCLQIDLIKKKRSSISAMYIVTGSMGVLHGHKMTKKKRENSWGCNSFECITLSALSNALLEIRARKWEQKERRQHQKHASSTDTTSSTKTIHNAEMRALWGANAQKHWKTREGQQLWLSQHNKRKKKWTNGAT